MIRSTRATMLALTLGACCRAAPATPSPPKEPPPMTDAETWRSLPEQPACVTALAALLTGELASWRGIAGCTGRDAEAAFGASQPAPTLLGPGRRHAVPAAGAMGIHVTYTKAHVEAVLLEPPWTADRLSALGPPDDDRPSGYGPEFRQLSWASRGLLAHVDHVDGSIWVIAAFAPTDLDALSTSRLFYLGVDEHPDR